MNSYTILIVKVEKRSDLVDSVQKLFTRYGCSIKMRLGLHEAGDVCSEEGLMILQMVPGSEDTEKLEKALNDMAGVSATLVHI